MTPRNAFTARKPLILGSAVALVTILIVAVVVTVAVPELRGGPRVNPAVLRGKWVHSGDACDTKRGDMIIDTDSMTVHMDGEQAAKMRIASITPKPPDALEVKFQSYNGVLVFFKTYTVKDPTTIVSEDLIWRKCS